MLLRYVTARFLSKLAEYVRLISSQANEVCTKENKKTILPEHVIRSLAELEFTAYVDPVKACHEKYKADAKVRTKPTQGGTETLFS